MRIVVHHAFTDTQIDELRDLANGHEVLARASGKIRMNFIRVLPGSRVLVEQAPYALSRGRITYRLR